MSCPQRPKGWPVLVVLLCVFIPNARSQEPTPAQKRSATRVPLDKIPESLRKSCQEVLEHPTLFSQGPTEIFAGNPTLYHWLLDHPDRAMMAWKRLGARCTSIVDRGQNNFSWNDHIGSEIRWTLVHREPTFCVWFAEGKVRPNALFPLFPVEALVLLRHNERANVDGRTFIFQQADVFLVLPGRAAAAATKLLGPSAPRLAEQGLGQLEMFFSGLVWYLDQHPDRTDKLLAVAEPGAETKPGDHGHAASR